MAIGKKTKFFLGGSDYPEHKKYRERSPLPFSLNSLAPISPVLNMSLATSSENIVCNQDHSLPPPQVIPDIVFDYDLRLWLPVAHLMGFVVTVLVLGALTRCSGMQGLDISLWFYGFSPNFSPQIFIPIFKILFTPSAQN